jgi:flagellar biosynthetic protein FliR
VLAAAPASLDPFAALTSAGSIEAALPYLYGAFLVFLRGSALLMVVPGPSARSVPVRVRMGLAVVLSTAAWMGAGSPHFEVPSTLAGLVLATGKETLYGVAGGLGARWVLEAAAAAGHIAGLAMGLGYGAQISPLTGADSPAVGQLLSMLSLGGAVALGLHRELVLWFCRSLQTAPLATAESLHTLFVQALGQGIAGLGLGARVSFPILIGVTSGHLALGLAGKFAPQISLQSVGFAVALLAGGAALYLFGANAAEMVARQAVAALRG